MECGKQLTAATPEFEKPVVGAERKHATVLFSDLAGYTALTERLDPEEVKEIMGLIFGEIGRLAKSYDGTIERFFGDEVLLLFGVPKAHEDDPIRAIRVAEGIHELIRQQSARFAEKIGQPLAMHIGINTGLVITGDEYIDKGRHGLTGDAVNLAARLTKRSKPGETLVGPETYGQALHHFEFEAMGPIEVKGKTDPIQVYKVLTPKEQPSTLHRTHGARADLIGRDKEMAALMETVERLDQGRGSIISICGDAGTGKSRLTREFKDRLNLDKIQWFEGHAYSYTQNTPYYPLIDLLTHAFQLEEGDAPERVRQKIESGLANLLGADNQTAAYIGGLFSLSYPEVTKVSPEFWKSRLYLSIKKIVSAVAKRGPTVICFEDLHWADPSFIDLFKALLKDLPDKVLFLCVYRPAFNLFDGQNPERLDQDYQDIRLQELSDLDAQAMLRSLLKSEAVPTELTDFVGNKAEGNPFYLEEVVNSLIESEILIRDNGDWKLARAISEADIPPSINGVLTARIDRLQKDAKRILQEASVIGRAFFYAILKRVSDLKVPIEEYLSGLEQLDLIRVRAFEPDLEYIFKHALTQEVVYNGILKKERQEIHERIGQAIEKLFKDRVSEFYETLAYHFTRGQSVTRAIDYLVKSGEKSLARYAVEEAHQYFRKAYDILVSKEELSESEKIMLIDILNSWGYSYYYLGEFKEFIALLKSHQVMAESLQDKARVGIFCAWFGIAYYVAGKSKDSYDYLRKALDLGEKTDNQKVIGYACTWLSFTCGEMGRFTEGIDFGERAQKIAESFPSDQYLFFKSLAGLSLIYFYKGDTRRVFEDAKCLLEYGERNANSRSKVFGHFVNALGFWVVGDMNSSQKSHEKAIRVAMDPFFSQFPKGLLGLVYLLGGQLREAENILQSCINFCETRDMGQFSVICQYCLAPVLIAKGQMKQGTELLEKAQETLIRNQRRVQYALSEYILGEVNAQIATGPKPSLSIMAKNIGFLLKTVPFATKKAEEHFNKAIELLKEIGAEGLLGPVYLSFGLLHKSRRRKEDARQCILEAINFFKQCGAEAYLMQANEVLESLR